MPTSLIAFGDDSHFSFVWRSSPRGVPFAGSICDCQMRSPRIAPDLKHMMDEDRSNRDLECRDGFSKVAATIRVDAVIQEAFGIAGDTSPRRLLRARLAAARSVVPEAGRNHAASWFRSGFPTSRRIRTAWGK